MFGFNRESLEWEVLPQYEKFKDMSPEALLELFLAHYERGDIDDKSFGFKLLDFYNAKGWLSDKQKSELIKIIIMLPELEISSNVVDDSLHLSETKVTYINTIDDGKVRLCRTMDEYKKYSKL